MNIATALTIGVGRAITVGLGSCALVVTGLLSMSATAGAVRPMNTFRPYTRRDGYLAPALLWTATVGACLLLAAQSAFASGSLPPEPVAAGRFSNFAECLAYLETTQRSQAALAMPEPLPAENGGTRQVLVTTKGVSRGPDEQATYDAEVGYEYRSIDTASQSIVTNYSWERYSLACRGAAFTGSLQKGYALPGSEAIRQ
ncbi:hypothetical protein FP026_29755 [Rhizobium tropici]|uniref:Uncharacterized protein n=1 Tax=Rhizobium tropici TaxID=398 RepID=A0A5B0VKK5_RHITR|nr:hypothetical protein [Rhizobium tropici]KAA1174635.1 hypothetical protein FP026_29755 [Rhizobium tropici]